MAPALCTRHPQALAVLHGDVEGHAFQQRKAFVGTAGSVVERTNASGFRYHAHQFYDGRGKKRESYLAGPAGSREADAAAADLRNRILELSQLLPSLRLLGREGFNLVDRAPYAALASLHNHGLFGAGAVLVGSHAYGVLLNRLGARASPYTTQDVDVARPARLVFAKRPGETFVGMLKRSGLDFVEVPGMDRKTPPTSFKQRGRSTFRVDLLAPARGARLAPVAVPELGAHALGLPHFEWLLAETQPGAVLSRAGCCAVRVPLPERFAIHKLIVSRLRTGRDTKSAKDVLQAAVLSAVLADTHPGAIHAAAATLRPGARRLLASALALARPLLEHAAPAAWEELSERQAVAPFVARHLRGA